MSKITLLQDLMPSIWSGNWAPGIRKRLFGDGTSSIGELCDMMMESDGEYSSLLISDRLLDAFEQLDQDGLLEFFTLLREEYDLDAERVERLARQYAETQDARSLHDLTLASEPRRQELFRRLNLAPGGIRRLVNMREELRRLIQENPELAKIDADFRHLFNSWFNRGFLTMLPIDWETPAHILEKIIAYEAVHEIGNWEELRNRIVPNDRYCFGFFHPAMEDDPLVFVEVALTAEMPENIGQILAPDRKILDPESANCAVFYSISNCHTGLAGVSFGNFLIKQVATSLNQRFPNLKSFVTISPAPDFRKWLESEAEDSIKIESLIEKVDKGEIDLLEESDKLEYLHQGSRYYLEVKNDNGRPIDSVARFHLKNGAKLERINFLANTSDTGIRQSLGMMVNYNYDLQKVEENHERYMNDQEVVCSSQVRKLLGKGGK